MKIGKIFAHWLPIFVVSTVVCDGIAILFSGGKIPVSFPPLISLLIGVVAMATTLFLLKPVTDKIEAWILR